MKYIAHRGNIAGDSVAENQMEHLQKALDAGFDIEVDVWLVYGQLCLGHDVLPTDVMPRVSENFLEDPRIWVHAKNLPALALLSNNPGINCFWHQGLDSVTLTSKGFIWGFTDVGIADKSVIVDIAGNAPAYGDCYAVCSDYVARLSRCYV